jgi:hypothetical protein
MAGSLVPGERVRPKPTLTGHGKVSNAGTWANTSAMELPADYGARSSWWRVVLLSGAVFLVGVGTAGAEEPLPGRPAEDAPPPEKGGSPHPEPRVIVNVLSVVGAHKPAEVERSARFGWGRIVRCYKANDPRETAIINMDLLVTAGGAVASARRVSCQPKHRELAICLERTMKGLAMPKARTGSIAHVEIRVAPGDPPSKSDRSLSPE